MPGAGDALWKPTSGAAGGYALQPFADNGLAGDMITIRGVSTLGYHLNGSGGLEGGTVVCVTGVGSAARARIAASQTTGSRPGRRLTRSCSGTCRP